MQPRRRFFVQIFAIGAAMPADEDEMGYRRGAGGAGKGEGTGFEGTTRSRRHAGWTIDRAGFRGWVAGEGRGGEGRGGQSTRGQSVTTLSARENVVIVFVLFMKTEMLPFLTCVSLYMLHAHRLSSVVAQRQQTLVGRLKHALVTRFW